MSKKVLDRLSSVFANQILSTSNFRGDEEALVAPADWLEVASFLKSDPELSMDHFIDITAVDYPDREPRFDVLLFMRSMKFNHRIRIKTSIAEDVDLDTLSSVWPGTNWAEREVFDMFGIRFKGHPDMRRILLYPEFVGFPLRKDYPIEKTQPLIAYRDVEGTDKLPPFGPDMGQPWGRVDWIERAEGRDLQVSPAIGLQEGQRPALSQGIEYAEATIEHSLSDAKE